MANTVINKASIKPIPTDHYIISTNDVVNYLQNQLGFSIGYDFTRWVGVSVDHSYIRMRAIINPKDIVYSAANKDYVDSVLAANAAGIMYKDTVIETLKPFMYPKSITNIRNHPEDLQRIAEYGLYGERLDEVIQYSQLNYCKQADVFRLYLRPERIIVDMLSDPATNKVDGEIVITGTHGTTSETIRWDVEVTKNNAMGVSSDISIDRIFSVKS